MGWWVPAVVVFTVVMCFVGPVIDGESYWLGALMATGLLLIEMAVFASVKYEIRDGRLGIRNLFFRWDWYPIDKISEVKAIKSVLSASALSFDRLAIRFSDKSILKSSMPLEISPKDRSAFLAELLRINPSIVVKGV